MECRNNRREEFSALLHNLKHFLHKESFDVCKIMLSPLKIFSLTLKIVSSFKSYVFLLLKS